MTSDELRQAILTHLRSCHPGTALSAYDFARVFGLHRGTVSWTRRHLREMEAEGELVSVQGRRDENDFRPATRWGLPEARDGEVA